LFINGSQIIFVVMDLRRPHGRLFHGRQFEHTHTHTHTKSARSRTPRPSREQSSRTKSMAWNRASLKGWCGPKAAPNILVGRGNSFSTQGRQANSRVMRRIVIRICFKLLSPCLTYLGSNMFKKYNCEACGPPATIEFAIAVEKYP
jgi:hypothetical protein